MRQTLTSTLMRSVNRSAILDLIRQNSPITRAQIARKLGVSLPTVMRIVDILIEEDLVRNCGSNESSGGRPASLLEYNGQSYAVLGVDLSGSKMYGAVADLSGNIQSEISVPVNHHGANGNLELLLNLIQQLLDAPRPAGQNVRGIGLGMPGVTLSREGIVTWAPSFGWRDLPIKEILSTRFGYSVFIENDVNLIALGELHFGAGKGISNLVCITVGTGIGAGIIINRALYRGHNQASGEIGYLLPNIQALGRNYDEFGALESLASGTGIARCARERIIELGLELPEAEVSAEDVFSAARDGQAWALEVAKDTIDLLSMTVTNISALLDPEMIILGGGVIRSADLLLEPIRQRIQGTAPYLPRIEASQLGSRAAVMGAIMLVLSGTSEQYIIERVH